LLWIYFDGSLAFYWDVIARNWNGPNRIHYILSNIFILGYNTMWAPSVGTAWSLDIEMQFYLIAPVIAIFLAWRKIPTVWILLAVISISLASSLLRNPVSLLSYLAFFVFGMTAASINWRPSGNLAFASLGAAVVLIAGCLASPWRGILLSGGHLGSLSIYTTHANVVLALLAVPYAIYTTRQVGFGMDGMFADLSYVIYLLHWVVAMWIRSNPGSPSHNLLLDGAGGVLVIGVSFLIWKFYDHPINRRRSRWVSGRKKIAAVKVVPAQTVEAVTEAS
jgi:peptidoglycan/LPS O-acetylase OafA/YrhL